MSDSRRVSGSLGSSGNRRKTRRKVEARDAEVERMTGLLEGGRPYDVVALEARNRSNERLISHLNIQIDYLQQKNQDVQRQLDQALVTARLATTEKAHLDTRNVELEQELKDVDYMAHRLQSEKETMIRSADMEINDTMTELTKSRTELETLDYEVAKFKADNEGLLNDLEAMKDSMNTEKVNRQRLEDLMDKVQEDKRRLSQRVNKLTSNERDLVLEIDRLKHRNGMAAGKKRSKSPGHMEAFIHGLEEERDYWKGEVEVLQKLMRTRSSSTTTSSSSSRPSSRSSSPTRSRSANVTPTKSKSKKRSSSPFAKKESMSLGSLEAELKIIEDERDHYKRECDILKTMRTRPISPVRTPTKAMSVAEETEFLSVTRERDELQKLLDKFERHMAEIQANVKVLTGERDKLKDMYDEVKDELTRLRRDVVRSPKSPKTSLAAQAVLRRVENERDDAITELRKTSSERDTLRERVKIATDTQLADRARLEQRIEDLENVLHTVDLERGTLEDQLRSLQKFADSVEAQMRDQNLHLAEVRDEANQQKSTAAQLRLLAEQSEQSLTENQARLNMREGDLRSTSDQMLQMETRLAHLQRALGGDQDEIAQLRATVAALDREKDSLQTMVDEKTETIVQLHDQTRAKELAVNEYRANAGDMELTLERAKENLVAKEREILSLRRQLDSTSEELTEVGRSREVALRETRRLQDDLATMTRENQNLNAELQSTLDEGHELKTQMQDYMVDVKRTEDVLSSKEQERSDLLEQYRTLSIEAERYETQTHQLESEFSNLRLEMMTKDSEVRRLREKIDALEREVRDHMHAEQAYEIQVSSLTKSVASLEDTLRQTEGDRHTVMQDLSAVRDLCVRLEATKDQLQRQLTTKSLDQDKLQNLLDDMKSETDTLRKQVYSERTSVQNLEGLLQNTREKEFQTHLSAQERDTDVQLFKDRLALNESKIDSQGRELTALRTRNIDLESEGERLKRQLTSEKFERERAVQELRRNGLQPPGEGRYSSLGASSPSSRSRSPSRRSPYTTISALDDDTV